jgi:hypothetical protein
MLQNTDFASLFFLTLLLYVRGAGSLWSALVRLVVFAYKQREKKAMDMTQGPVLEPPSSIFLYVSHRARDVITPWVYSI